MLTVDSAEGDHDRGTSTTLGYVLALAVTAILVSGLLIAAGGLVEDERQRIIRNELEVIGQKFAANLEHADRLARTSPTDPTVNLTVALPDRVGGRGYLITVASTGGDEYRIDLVTDNPAVNVSIRTVVKTDTGETTVAGGNIEIRYVDIDGDTERELEVADAS